MEDQAGPYNVKKSENLRIFSLHFADEVGLLSSSGHDLQCVLEGFSNMCEAAGTRVSSSQSEAMVLKQKTSPPQT